MDLPQRAQPLQHVEEVVQGRWLEGVIVGRRVLGKNLAFATLQLSTCADLPDAIKHKQDEHEGRPALVKVKFRRQGPSSSTAEGGPSKRKLFSQPIVWEGVETDKPGTAACGRGCEHERGEPASFPQRRSQLQLGTRVLVKVCPQAGDENPPLAVMRWRVIARVGEVLHGAQSLSASKALADGATSESSARSPFHDEPGGLSAAHSGNGCGSWAGAPASSGGAFSVSDRHRLRHLAHSDAVAAQASCRDVSVGSTDSHTRAPLCKYWMVKGVCEAYQRGKCKNYRHEFASEEEQQRAERSKQIRAASLEASQEVQRIYDATLDRGDAVNHDSSWLTLPESLPVVPLGDRREQTSSATLGHGSETKQQKGRRAAAFVAWLLATYGPEALNEGTGVLDVAGGKGMISYELHCRHGIRCTLIDPGVRTRLLTPRQARALRKSGGTPFVHIAACFDEAFCTAGNESRENAEETSSTSTGALMRGASLVVGMHPDEATEAIVTNSIAHGKRFAVVPCCVFAHLFPHRTLLSAEGNKPVRDINDFCSYLISKDPRIEEATLPFEGRNKVLFMR